MTTQSSNILLVLANAVANFNGSMSDARSAANILVSNLGINGFTTQTMGVLVPFKGLLIRLGFNSELVNDFMSSLGVICDCKDKAIGKYTKQHIATIKSFLELANQRQAAIENAAYDAEMTVIAEHTEIAPIVAACAKSRELVELDECLNAQIAAAATVEAITANDTNGLFVQTANGEWAHVQDAADEAGLDVADYLDLYGDDLGSGDMFANCDTSEFDGRVIMQNSKPNLQPINELMNEYIFDNIPLAALQDIYADAKEQDGDDDDKNSADELVEQFAKLIHNKMQERHSFFLQKINSVGFHAAAFSYELLLHEQTKISLRVEENGNCHLKHLCAGVGNGSFCSVSFCAHLSQDFKKFFCRKIEAFFRDILRKI